MSAKQSASIYDELIQITRVYLGPASERFIARQVENHLHKPPSKLSAEDLLSLIDWIRVVVGLLTEDTEITEEYIARLRDLAERSNAPPTKPKRGKHGQ